MDAGHAGAAAARATTRRSSTFEFGQELVFAHDGRPFFHYLARAWIVDANGDKVRDAALGGRRLPALPPGAARWSCCSPHYVRALAEIWYGEAEAGGKLELATRPAMRPHRVGQGGRRAATRLYGNVEGDLLYAYDMAAMGQALQPHLWAQLAERPVSPMTTDWREKLREKGYRLTPQRELILDAVDPPSATRRRTRSSWSFAEVLGAQRLHRLPHPRGSSRNSVWCGTPTSATALRRTTRSATTSTSTWSAGISEGGLGST